MVEEGVNPGDLIEIINTNGVTQGMVYPTATAKRGHVAMVFGSPAGSQGNVTNGVNELNIPDYKHCWGNIRKVSNATHETAGITFKSKEIML